jgi:hypothetical protein
MSFDPKPYILGGFIDAYYRAGMNALVNKAIMRQSSANLSVNMTIQVPIRILYIVSYKTISANCGIDNKFLNSAVTGLVMTPISSLLEACNVYKKDVVLNNAKHGFVARGAREMAFAYAINTIDNPVGVGISAYFSHVPHILSTMKLVKPTHGYAELFREYVGGDWMRLVFPAGVLLRTTQIVGSCAIINVVGPWIYDRLKNIVPSNSE